MSKYAIKPGSPTASRVLSISDLTTTTRTESGAGAKVDVGPDAARKASFVVEAGDAVELALPDSFHTTDGAARPVGFSASFDSDQSRIKGVVENGRATFTVPSSQRGQMSLGFDAVLPSGSSTRVGGVNYRADVIPERGASAVFGGEWDLETEGVIQAGQKLELAYDAHRLGGVDTSRGESVKAFIQFDGHPVLSMTVAPLTHDGAPTNETLRPTLRIPYDARAASVWFEKTSADGQKHYDSNFGANYQFDIALPVENADPEWKDFIVRNNAQTHNFPNLRAENFEALSHRDPNFDCYAWAHESRNKMSVPAENWPAIEKSFLDKGYVRLDVNDTAYDPKREKIAGYGIVNADSGKQFWRHFARTDDKGRWMSKLGNTGSIIAHKTVEDVAGGLYGHVQYVWGRPRV